MIYGILTLHWFADFVLQTDKMATNKSTSIKWLSSHVGVYTLCLLPLGLRFALFNGMIHFGVDFFTSRATSVLWKMGDRHNFFAVIGFDQLIHTATLIATMPMISFAWGFL